LEEKFAKADQKAWDLAIAKAETLEKLAKAKRSKVEAEKSKVAAIHYQDPMDVDSEDVTALSETTSEVLIRPDSNRYLYQNLNRGVAGDKEVTYGWGPTNSPTLQAYTGSLRISLSRSHNK
jgi:uncharacterized protein (DUF1697 family)